MESNRVGVDPQTSVGSILAHRIAHRTRFIAAGTCVVRWLLDDETTTDNSHFLGIVDILMLSSGEREFTHSDFIVVTRIKLATITAAA